MTLPELIVKTAKSYIGITEITPNAGFSCPIFEDKMIAIGWKKGNPWCTYFAKLVWIEAFTQLDPELLPTLERYFSGYALITYTNFKASKEFKVRDYSVIGSIAIWKHGFTETGHGGIVITIHDDHFETIEGNTNDKIAEKIRHTGVPHIEAGLNLLGFIHPE